MSPPLSFPPLQVARLVPRLVGVSSVEAYLQALPLLLLSLPCFGTPFPNVPASCSNGIWSFGMGIPLLHDSLHIDNTPSLTIVALRVALRADSVFERASSKARFHVQQGLTDL